MYSTPSPDVATSLSSLPVEAPKHPTRLKVALLSLPARTQAVLEFFFNSTGRSSFVPATEDQSDAAIFDLDTIESRQHWQLYQERTGRPGIALSVQPQQLHGTVWVQKPVTPAALLSAASEILHQRVHPPVHAPTATATAAPTAPAATMGSTPEAVVAPAPTLLEPALAGHPAAAASAHLEQALSALPDVAAARGPDVPPLGQVRSAPSPTTIAEEPTALSTVAFAPTTPGALEPVSEVSEPSAASLQEPAASPTGTAPAARPDAMAGTPATTSPAPPAPARSAAPKAGGLGGLLRRWFGASDAPPPPTSPRSGQPTPARSSATGSHSAAALPPRPLTGQVDKKPEEKPDEKPGRATSGTTATPRPISPTASAEPAATTRSAESATGRSDPPSLREEAATSTAPAEQPSAAPAAAPDSQAQPVTGGVKLGGVSAAAQGNDLRLCGRMEDRSAQALAEDPELRYDPEVHLVSVLREAYLVGTKWQVPTHLECSAGRVVVDATRNLLLCDFDVRLLENLITTPLGKRPKTRTLSRQEQAELQHTPLAGAGVQRLDETLWLAGLLTAGGRLPIDTDPNRPVYLRHWPNLTRLSALPHAVRIAALWSMRGASILETAGTLGIAQRHVIAFYNGALALDLITEDGSHIRRAQRKAGRNRGLLTRLLGWLNR